METLFWAALAIIAVIASSWLIISLCIIAGAADMAMEDDMRENDKFERDLKRVLGSKKWRARWEGGKPPTFNDGLGLFEEDDDD